MLDQWLLRNILLLLAFVFISFVFFRKKQDARLSWALFFSSLWVIVFLLLTNGLSVYLDFWSFNPEENLNVFIPYDLYFVWIVFWGVLPAFILKGRFILISTLCLLWLDVLLMPYLETLGILQLKEYWLLGELLLIVVVYIPSQIWASLFLAKKGLKWRSLFQFLVLSVIYGLGIPFVVYLYFPEDINFIKWEQATPYILQLAFIILLPALVAVIDLGQKGKGTPFPYDATTKLVKSGVYAYIRNPIQWSLTFFFIPLALFFHSYVLLTGIIVSVAYTIGVSEQHEQTQLKALFSTQWLKYKKNVPLWYFSWQPRHIPEATIYIRKNCNTCSQLRRWLEQRKPIHLHFEDAENFKNGQLSQLTYKGIYGQYNTSVKALAHSLEHINLAWASLGWFMRLPGINQLLQLIIDSMGLINEPASCESI